MSLESSRKLQITWDNPKELEVYIGKSQSAAERLSTENRKLRKWHTDFTEKVILPQFLEENRLLRAVAGGGLDSLSSLRSKWDKLELMMESHQLMIKEQVEVDANSPW
ncbi:hypothetical protein DPEC_G00243130 [Dallia pectoralis]|uniref:Uncharacterized protein n=1 Tax=Dallia pectoralis TaxID=75939 RepID=A0ACC2FVF5_DALPE|nr:hypothetical protein DPEC_G00243130 [Dallia pectoralis]